MLYSHKTFEYEFPLEEADVALLGIPFSSTQTGECVKHGPLFIREAIKNIPGNDPESGKNPFDSLKFCDVGDVSIVPGNWKLTSEAITDTIRSMKEGNPKIFPVILGGEHLVTLAIVNELAKEEKLTIVDFDAHRDLMKDWMGEPYSHITWAARALENPNINLVQIGCRAQNSGEIEPFRERIKETLEGIEGRVYLTIDLDVLDPSITPEVGTPEPVGMDQEKLFGLLKDICKLDLVGMDIVECASVKVNTRTALIAANIFKKVMLWNMSKT